MSITLSLDWWLIPACITLAAYAWFARYTIKRGPPTGDYDFGADVIFVFLVACVVTLFTWAAYFATLYYFKP